jgi:hypothetical protein
LSKSFLSPGQCFLNLSLVKENNNWHKFSNLKFKTTYEKIILHFGGIVFDLSDRVQPESWEGKKG